jgi:hypothetical protein
VAFALLSLYARTGNKDLRNQYVGKIMDLKLDKSYYEIIQINRVNAEIKVYVPDPHSILPVIRESLLDQAGRIIRGDTGTGC